MFLPWEELKTRNKATDGRVWFLLWLTDPRNNVSISKAAVPSNDLHISTTWMIIFEYTQSASVWHLLTQTFRGWFILLEPTYITDVLSSTALFYSLNSVEQYTRGVLCNRVWPLMTAGSQILWRLMFSVQYGTFVCKKCISEAHVA